MKLSRTAAAVVLAVTLTLIFAGCGEELLEPKRPRLVLMVTVDQLRTDFIQRFEHRLRPRGFRYLLKDGVYFTDARYRHSHTATGPGHATIVTGAGPCDHGIVGNRWFDRRLDRTAYTVEDSRHQVLGFEPVPGQGTSPANLLSTTIGDELVMARAGKSRSFSVSFKDRAAILTGGHLGKAFWYSPESGDFVTSTYYYAEIPKWLRLWNRQELVERYRGKRWRLMEDVSRYTFAQQDDRPYEIPFMDLGRTMPHLLPSKGDDQFYNVLRATPFADRLLLDFVKELMMREKIGRQGATDFLSVSFSATDFVGHTFGPASLEAEDNFLRVDHVLAELFQFIEKRVGLDRTVIVLTSDHGVAEAPEYLAELGFDVGRHVPSEFLATLNRSLRREFGTTRDLVTDFVSQDLVVDEKLVHRLDLALPICRTGGSRRDDADAGLRARGNAHGSHGGQLRELAADGSGARGVPSGPLGERPAGRRPGLVPRRRAISIVAHRDARFALGVRQSGADHHRRPEHQARGHQSACRTTRHRSHARGVSQNSAALGQLGHGPSGRRAPAAAKPSRLKARSNLLRPARADDAGASRWPARRREPRCIASPRRSLVRRAEGSAAGLRSTGRTAPRSSGCR